MNQEIQEALDMTVNFRPVFFNQEKRGHLSFNSAEMLLDQPREPSLEDVDEEANAEKALNELLSKLNKVRSEQGANFTHQFLSKVDRFTLFNGTICCFLNNKETIEELNRRKNSIINSDDELAEQPTRDPELIGSESANSEPKVFEDFDEGIGLAKSAFRELHGVPLKAPFLSKIVVEITLNNSEFNLEELFGESRYVWIQHQFKNS